MRKKLFSYILFLIAWQAIAQPSISLEGWQTHLNYSQAKRLALAQQKVYAATDNSLFYFDKEDNSLRKLSTIDGLSEISISALGFNADNNTLVIGYRNGNIDLLFENTIVNLAAIKDASITGAKTINHISTLQDEAYLATDFGVVVLNLSALEVKETWYPGEEGAALAIKQSVIANDSIYLLTSQHLLSASLTDGSNLQDFRNWQRKSLPVGESVAIVSWIDEVILAIGDKLWQQIENGWNELPLTFENSIRNVSAANGNLIVVTQRNVITVTPELQTNVLTAQPLASPWHVIFENGVWWIADEENGLVNNFEQGWQGIFPSGPANNNVAQLFTTPNRIFGLPAAKNENNAPLNLPAQFSLYQNNQWETYGEQLLPMVEDLSAVGYDPINNITWLASYGDGLIQWNGDNFRLINNQTPDSPLSIFNDDEMWISDLVVGNQEEVWFSIYNATPPLHQITTDGIGESYLPGSRANFANKIIRYGNGDIWMAIAGQNGGGIVVYNPDDQQSRLLTSGVGSGGLPGNIVNDIMLDRDGFIWVGTNEGVAYFPNPFLALANQPIDAVAPIFNQRRLLSTEIITTLAIDAGNRKWIGTNNGIWLFGPGGEELFYNFNTENSPLLSNEILDIAILDETGEVFIATSEGIISFRSTATRSRSNYESIKIFPNPVRATFQGLIAIEGLVNNTVVKITTISGQLIKEINSYGGMATWDVTDYNNRRVSTGIYLVMMADENGEQHMVGKIAVVE